MPRTYSRQHPLEHRFKRIATGHNKKARDLGRSGRITYVDLYHIYLASDGICHYCGIGISPEHCSFDHSQAFDRGGDNVPGNIVACCLTCQRGKYTKSPEEYEEWRNLRVTCPVDGTVFQPRWADYVRGFGKYCSRACAGAIGGQISRKS
jgi:hypothetical protein